MNANIRRNATNHQIPNLPNPQKQTKVRIRKCTFARLIDYRLTRLWIKLRNGVMTSFLSHQETTERTLVSNS